MPIKSDNNRKELTVIKDPAPMGSGNWGVVYFAAEINVEVI